MRYCVLILTHVKWKFVLQIPLTELEKQYQPSLISEVVFLHALIKLNWYGNGEINSSAANGSDLCSKKHCRTCVSDLHSSVLDPNPDPGFWWLKKLKKLSWHEGFKPGEASSFKIEQTSSSKHISSISFFVAIFAFFDPDPQTQLNMDPKHCKTINFYGTYSEREVHQNPNCSKSGR